MTLSIILCVLLTGSISYNLFLFREIKRMKKRPQSLELQEFLGDLLSGYGIVAVGRLDPSDILLRSPKQR